MYDEKTIYAILDILSKRLKDEKKDVNFLSNKVDTFINGYNRAILIAISTITELIGKTTPLNQAQENIPNIVRQLQERILLASEQDKKIFFDALMNPLSPNTKLQQAAQENIPKNVYNPESIKDIDNSLNFLSPKNIKTRFNIGDIIEHTQPGFFEGQSCFHVIGEVVEIIQGETLFIDNKNTSIREFIKIKDTKENIRELITTEEYTQIIQKVKDK